MDKALAYGARDSGFESQYGLSCVCDLELWLIVGVVVCVVVFCWCFSSTW